MTWNDRVNEAMELRGLTRAELSDRLSLHGMDADDFFARIEDGGKAIRISEGVFLAASLGVSLEWLTGRSDNPDLSGEEAARMSTLATLVARHRDDVSKAHQQIREEGWKGSASAAPVTPEWS